MKTIFKLIVIIMVIGLASCRDTKKEEAELEAQMEQIESIEVEAATLTEKVNAEAKELEEALKELDSI